MTAPKHYGRAGVNGLTPRELQVMQSAARGDSAKDTAQLLGLDVETVKDHRSSALRRMQARNCTHAVAMLVAAGVVQAVAG